MLNLASILTTFSAWSKYFLNPVFSYFSNRLLFWMIISFICLTVVVVMILVNSCKGTSVSAVSITLLFALKRAWIALKLSSILTWSSWLYYCWVGLIVWCKFLERENKQILPNQIHSLSKCLPSIPSISAVNLLWPFLFFLIFGERKVTTLVVPRIQSNNEMVYCMKFVYSLTTWLVVIWTFACGWTLPLPSKLI